MHDIGPKGNVPESIAGGRSETRDTCFSGTHLNRKYRVGPSPSLMKSTLAPHGYLDTGKYHDQRALKGSYEPH